FRALFLRSDLRAARPDPACVGGRAQTRARRGRRASVPLSTHHRAEHPVCGAPCGWQARLARRRAGPRTLRYDTDGLRRRRASWLRDFQPRTARGRVPAQSHLLARAGICRHRTGRARPARDRDRAPRHGDRKAAEKLAYPVESLGHGMVSDEPLTREQVADEFLFTGLRLAEGIDPATYARLAGRQL